MENRECLDLNEFELQCLESARGGFAEQRYGYAIEVCRYLLRDGREVAEVRGLLHGAMAHRWRSFFWGRKLVGKLVYVGGMAIYEGAERLFAREKPRPKWMRGVLEWVVGCYPLGGVGLRKLAEDLSFRKGYASAVEVYNVLLNHGSGGEIGDELALCEALIKLEQVDKAYQLAEDLERRAPGDYRTLKLVRRAAIAVSLKQQQAAA